MKNKNEKYLGYFLNISESEMARAFVPIIISISEEALWCVPLKLKNMTHNSIVSRVAQWQRAGPITQRSEDQNLALLRDFTFCYIFPKK